MMNFAFKMMNFVLKMMNLALKMTKTFTWGGGPDPFHRPKVRIFNWK